MSASVAGRVVVGVDGSPDSVRALDWALEAARGLPARVHVIHASPPVPDLLGTGAAFAGGEEHGHAILEPVLARAHQVPEVEVTSEVSSHRPAPALVEAAPGALAVVLGARGHGRVSGALLGSVSQTVARHAPCPVVVVREAMDAAAQRIVVGVDGSPGSAHALDFALRLAQATGRRLLALRAWQDPALDRSGVVLALRPDLDPELRRTELAGVDEQLAQGRESYPDVDVMRDVVPAHPQRMLADASQHAALVVVGSRGRGGVSGLLLGSVSQSLLQHAACPVAVVR